VNTVAWAAVTVAVYSVCVIVVLAFFSAAARPMARPTTCLDRDLARSV